MAPRRERGLVRGVSRLIGRIPNRPVGLSVWARLQQRAPPPIPQVAPTLWASVLGCADVGPPAWEGWLGSVGTANSPPYCSSHPVEHGSRVLPRHGRCGFRSEPTPSCLGIPAGAPWRPLAYIGGEGTDPPPRVFRGGRPPPLSAVPRPSRRKRRRSYHLRAVFASRFNLAPPRARTVLLFRFDWCSEVVHFDIPSDAVYVLHI